MEKERKITAPYGCEIEKVEIVDGVAVVTFKEKEQKLPKSWEEFCEIFPIKKGECSIDAHSNVIEEENEYCRKPLRDRNVYPDRATADAVNALCQLIQLRNCYNGDWVPDWTDEKSKFVIHLYGGKFTKFDWCHTASSPLYFKTEELRDEFRHNFLPLIEKLKPLYGIKKGGKE